MQPIQEPSAKRTTLDAAPNIDWQGLAWPEPPPRVRLGARGFQQRTSRSVLAANPSWEFAIVFCQSSIVSGRFLCSPTVIHFCARLT